MNDDGLAFAESVAEVLAERGISTAMIGATAMAVHGYVRATQDIDLGTVGLSIVALRELGEQLRARGFVVELREPDAADPLGGLLRVEGGPGRAVDIVNFGNPWTGAGRRIGETGLAAPWVALAGRRLGVVGLPGLIVLKLAAGSGSDLRDVSELIARNPAVDLAGLRATARALRLDRRLERAIEDLAERGDREPLP